MSLNDFLRQTAVFIGQTIAVTPNHLAPTGACAHHERKGILRMLVASGERRVMPAGMFIIGLVLLWVGVSSRLARRELRNAELAVLDYPVRVATFWERDATASRKAHFDKFLEHKNWRNNLRFELTNWTIFGIGAALCFLGVVLSLGDDQSHIWDRVWDIVGPFVIAVVGIYYVYQLMKRLDKAESEVRWLSFMLKQVKDSGQVDYAELERRLERLEGVKSTDEGT
jgi:hypothetical protein